MLLPLRWEVVWRQLADGWSWVLEVSSRENHKWNHCAIMACMHIFHILESRHKNKLFCCELGNFILWKRAHFNQSHLDHICQMRKPGSNDGLHMNSVFVTDSDANSLPQGSGVEVRRLVPPADILSFNDSMGRWPLAVRFAYQIKTAGNGDKARLLVSRWIPWQSIFLKTSHESLIIVSLFP